jgi:hypothetical protein
MAPKYSSSPIEAILEASEDDARSGTIRGKEAALEADIHSKRQDILHESNMSLSTTRSTTERQRDKPRRSHRSSAGSMVSRHPGKSRAKAGLSRRGIATASRDDPIRHHQYHTSSGRDVESSSSSSSEEDDKIEDHRAVLAAARDRLTSPSLISTLTSLTTATNNSGSSSGSNSTVTQASISRGPVPKPTEPLHETPLSPGACL